MSVGDLVDGSPEKRAADVAPLAKLRAGYGIFACLGNHEYYSGLTQWRAAYQRLGFNLLYNSGATVDLGAGRLYIAGVTDPAAEGPRFNLPGPDAVEALAGAPEGAVKILLAHQPRRAADYARAGADLQLSGHTHGGHLKGLDLIVKKANDGFVAGWYQVAGLKLYVSRGTGLWNGFPLRLGVPSEITVMTLRSAAGR